MSKSLSEPLPLLSSFAHLVTAGLLIAMAGLQLNDPDPLYWIAVYLLAASIPLCQLINLTSTTVYWIAAGMILSGLLITAPGFADFIRSENWGAITGEMMNRIPYVESAREFGGLAIAACILAFYRPKAAT